MPVFDQIPRLTLAHLPTPLEHAPRLSAQLGIELLIKRDDCTGLAGGGNKARKLEYLLADAKRLGADTLVTIGGLQSNHARQTAAAAARPACPTSARSPAAPSSSAASTTPTA